MLLLVVAYEAMYFPEDRQEVILSLKKPLRWLRVRRVSNGMAVHAYSIFLGILKKLSFSIKIVSAFLGLYYYEHGACRGNFLCHFPIFITPPPHWCSQFKTNAYPGHCRPHQQKRGNNYIRGTRYHPNTLISTQTYKPYPDVLNPVENPHTSVPSPVTPVVSHIRQQHSQDAPQRPQYSDETPEQHDFHMDVATGPYHLPSSRDAHDLEPDINPFVELLLATSGLDNVMLPGWFVTGFDEQNPLSGFMSEGDRFEAHEEDTGQG